MQSRSAVLLFSTLVVLSAGALTLVGASRSTVRAARSPRPTLVDAPLADHRRELLDLAWETASALPTLPHRKNRAKAQEAVVDACLELGQAQRSLALVEKIDNWRRGAGYADLAFYCAEHDHVAAVQPLVDIAQQLSDSPREDSAQDWQRDRIRAGIARTLLRVGKDELAADFANGLPDSEAGRVETVCAATSDLGAFGARLEAVDAVVAKGQFDQVRNALEGCARIFDRVYDDASRRSQVEDKIKSSWSRLPTMVRFDLTLDLVRSALEHGDRTKALELLVEARAIVDGDRWTPEDHVRLKARLAADLHRAGEATSARSEADSALALYDAERERIAGVFRGAVLRPLAETYRSMGADTDALAVYERAVLEGAANPNARPRAEDLSATCCSMAESGVEPDRDLWARMREIRDGLREPW